jgi:hypothetical protein
MIRDSGLKALGALVLVIAIGTGLTACGSSSSSSSSTTSKPSQTGQSATDCSGTKQFTEDHAASIEYAYAHSPLVDSILANVALVTKYSQNPDASNLAALKQAMGPTEFAALIAQQTELSQLVIPYEAQLKCVLASSTVPPPTP